MAKILQFQRSDSFEKLIEELRERGGGAEGVIAVILEKDGHAHFRLSGFAAAGSVFRALGTLDWVKAELLADLVGEPEE